MILSSNFNDYYDNLALNQKDDGVFYERNTSEIKDPSFNLHREIFLNKIPKTENDYFTGYSKIVAILFCGKIYFSIYLDCGRERLIKLNYLNIEDYIGVPDLQKINYTGKTYKHFYELDNLNKRLLAIKSVHGSSIPDELFIKYKVPCLSIECSISYNTYHFDLNSEGVITLNPKLKDLNFQKYIDSFTAYSDLTRYLSQILIIPPYIPELKNNEKISKHGFDKNSFRK